MESTNEGRTARIIWAAHILSYLTKQQSNVRLQGLQIEAAGEDEEDELDDELEDEQLDAATEKTVSLSASQESIRFRFLDCVAQLLSPSKGWDYVTATALREREDFVEIDVARNDCFGATRGGWSSGAISMDPGIVEEEYFRKLEKFLAVADPSQTVAPSCEFVSDAIAYTGGRIDHWVDKLRGLLHVGPGRSKRKKQPSPQEDAKIWTDFKCLLFQGTAATANFRDKIVNRAYKCVLSTDIRQFLHKNPQPKNGRKIWYALKSLARPVLDCRIVHDIAIQHAQFRNIRICPVRQRHKTSLQDAYRDEYEGDIVLTWHNLARDSSLFEAKTLVGFNDKFKSDCSKSFALHAEMQLFLHYETGAALSPTLDYFGCSKKICLLCESFLQAFARPIATRGRHGVCYPAWGIPPLASPETAAALEKLDKILVSRVKSHLANSARFGQRLVAPAVHQSTVASVYTDAEVVRGLHGRVETTESARRAEEKLRVLRSIQQGHKAKHLYLDPALPESQQYASCVMCNHRPANLCSRCRSCYYCSKECQESDWRSHKLLCQKFVNQQPPRPSSSHKRAILFPADDENPRMIWVLCERIRDPDDGVTYDSATLHPLLGSDNPFIATSHIEHNPIRGRQLGSGIALWARKKAGYAIALRYRETFLVDGSLPNRSIMASAGIVGAVPHKWCGSVVAMRTTWSEHYEDMTLADFRHTLDFLLSYGTTETKQSNFSSSSPSYGQSQSRPPTAIRGVMISCYGERKLHGSDRFIAVDVPTHHPTRTVGKSGSISPISRHLGMPLRLYKYPDIERWIDIPGWNRNLCPESNQDAAFLMMETDTKSSSWGFAPLYWNTQLGNVLVVRDDGKDLDVDHLGAICRFVRKRLLPMFEESDGFGSVQRTRKEVLEFITADNLEKFKEMQMGCGDESDSDYLDTEVFED